MHNVNVLSVFKVSVQGYLLSVRRILRSWAWGIEDIQVTQAAIECVTGGHSSVSGTYDRYKLMSLLSGKRLDGKSTNKPV